MAKLFGITLGNTASLQICEAIFSAPLFNFNFIGLSWFGAQILEKKSKYILFSTNSTCAKEEAYSVVDKKSQEIVFSFIGHKKYCSAF